MQTADLLALVALFGLGIALAVGLTDDIERNTHNAPQTLEIDHAETHRENAQH